MLHKVFLGCLATALLCLAVLNNSTDSAEPPKGANQINALADQALTDNSAPLLHQVYTTPPLLSSELDQPETDIPSSQATSLPARETLEEEPLTKEIVTVVKSGDSLSSAFKRANVDSKYMYHLLNNHPKAKSLAKIYPGHKLNFTLNSDDSLLRLEHIIDPLNREIFTRLDEGYSFETITEQPEIRLARAEGLISNSLYMAGKVAKLDDGLTMSLAGIFGWDIDFALDIRKNDSFTVVYEEKYLNGKYLGTGAIVAAEFINQGQSYKAVRYEDREGNAQYYTPDGKTMRKAFLRSPIEFARVSSHFNLNRKHPILNTIRAHNGTDYAAPRGTPIQAAGDGKVIFAGKKGGYGNVLILQHGQTYQTLYAHLSKFGKSVRVGKTVKQGQVVAYVGTTGLSTAPHLHYEFRVNGAVRNPVTVKLPNADPVAKAERERFKIQTRPLVAKLENLTTPATQIARQEQSEKTHTPM